MGGGEDHAAYISRQHASNTFPAHSNYDGPEWHTWVRGTPDNLREIMLAMLDDWQGSYDDPRFEANMRALLRVDNQTVRVVR